jgi:tetrachlorobenzoquinone reductase
MVEGALELEVRPTLVAGRPGRTTPVRLRAMSWEAPGVLSLTLAATDDRQLPAFTPGSHIDLHLPDGTVRQYSLCGDPTDRSHYRIAVRSIHGGKSSQYVHLKLRPGELLRVSAPRNNFPFIDSPNYIFVAGGIGITPLIPMILDANAKRRRWTLFYCNRSDEEAAFLAELRQLNGEVSTHSTSAGTRLDVGARLRPPLADTLVYCCGPARLMTAVEAATSVWPADTVRFEWFSPRSQPDDEALEGFEVVCAASGLTLFVPPDKSILEVLREAGIGVPSSCQQGVCGTCEVSVLSGAIDHRDSILSAPERASNALMMTCISRALGPRLVLDI